MSDFNIMSHPFTSRLTNPKPCGVNRWLFSCPCTEKHKNNDKNQSLSVTVNYALGGLGVKCHTGCRTEDIVSAVGCTMSDLFFDKTAKTPMSFISWYAKQNSLSFDEIYDYGDGLYKARLYDEDGKTFRWFHTDNTKPSGFKMGRNGYNPRLYVAGNLKEDKTVIVAEGEKDTETIHRITGLTAVSAENGATKGAAEKKWSQEYTEQLAEKDIFILYDNDEAGKHFAEIEANNLLGIANSVKLMDITTVWPDCPDKGDITDLAVAVGDDETKKRIDKLFINATPATKTEVIEDITVKQAVEQQKAMSTEDIAKALMQTLSDVEPQGKQYIFKPYLPIGKFSLLNADPGVGKTKVASGIAALVTTGSPLLGIKCERQGKVLLFSLEDDSEDFLHTISACGGDTSKVIVIKDNYDSLKLLKKHRLTYDSPIVEEMIKQVQPALVIFDPYQKYLPKGVDMNRANELSDALSSVVRLAKQYDCHIMIIGHNTKAQTSLAYRFMGSQDLLGESRSGLSVVRDPERVREQENLIIHVKSNNKTGKSIRYRIESIPGNEDYARIAWLGFEDYTESDYAKAQRKKLKETNGEPSPLTTDNPVVRTIMVLLKENPEGVAIGYDDFMTAKELVTGSVAYMRIETEVNKVSAWLNSEYGIGVTCRNSSTLKPYYLNGNLQIPTKNKDRHVYIRRNRNVDIQQQIFDEVMKTK